MNSAPRPAEHLVLGLNGPIVAISGRIAALLLARAGLERYHRDHRGEDRELDEALVALKVIAAMWRTAVADCGQDPPSPRQGGHSSAVSGWSTRQAAKRLGCSDRTVRWAIANGRLAAKRIGAGWVLDPEEVEHFRARRTA